MQKNINNFPKRSYIFWITQTSYSTLLYLFVTISWTTIKEKKAELAVWIVMLGFSNPNKNTTGKYFSVFVRVLSQVSLSHSLDYSPFWYDFQLFLVLFFFLSTPVVFFFNGNILSIAFDLLSEEAFLCPSMAMTFWVIFFLLLWFFSQPCPNLFCGVCVYQITF